MRQSYITIDKQDALAPFDFESSPNAANMAEPVYEVLKQICDVESY
jgi:hypothetical protein